MVLQLATLAVKICQTAIVVFCVQLQKRAYYIVLCGIFLPAVCQVRVEIESCRMPQKNTIRACGFSDLIL